MSKIENNSRASLSLTRLTVQNPSFRHEYNLILFLVGLATIALILLSEKARAQLYEGEKVVTVTNASWVRLRSTPEIRSDTVLTRVLGGTQLRYRGTQGEWFQVELPNGDEGWLHRSYGRLDSAHDQLKVSASIARIRETPDAESPVVARAIQGLMLEILQEEPPWYKVRLPLGGEGWVREDMVTVHAVEPQSPPDQMTSVDFEGTEKDDGGPSPERDEANLGGIDPLQTSSAALATADESGVLAQTLRSPQDLDKPRLLMLVVSVIVGFSAFAVILMVGAVAVRRRARSVPPAEETQSDLAPPAPREKANQDYSDPLLKWMNKSRTGTRETKPLLPLPADPSRADFAAVLKKPEPLPKPEKEPVPAKVEPVESDTHNELETPPKVPVQEPLPEIRNIEVSKLQDLVVLGEKRTKLSITFAEAPSEEASPSPPVVEQTAGSAEKKPQTSKSGSSRSRSRKRGKRRRRKR